MINPTETNYAQFKKQLDEADKQIAKLVESRRFLPLLAAVNPAVPALFEALVVEHPKYVEEVKPFKSRLAKFDSGAAFDIEDQRAVTAFAASNRRIRLLANALIREWKIAQQELGTPEDTVNKEP